METGINAWHLYTACKLTLTHYYEPNDHRYDTYGTGFVTQFPPGDARFALVTNRHLTDIPWTKPQYEGTRLESLKIEIWQSENFRLEFNITDPKPVFHEDDSIDVSVVPFGPEMDKKTMVTVYDSIDKLVPDPNAVGIEFKHAMSWTYLERCEQLWPDLQPGEAVAFPGYPAWFDKLQSRPVFRSGVISSDPQRDYRQRTREPSNVDGNQQVLFDAFSTSGNSGSPVFVGQRGLAPLELQMKIFQNVPAQKAKLDFKPYHPTFLAGINAGHFNDTDSDRPNDHAGLSRMHTLSVIMDVLRANTVPTAGARTTTLLVPKDEVDAYGGFPPNYFTQGSDASKTAAVRDETIMMLHQEGKSRKAIAAEVGCSASTVGRVINKHVDRNP